MKPAGPAVPADGMSRGRWEYPAWIVPLLDDAGALCGSGVVVTSRHVLTCNHVAVCAERTQAGARITVVHTEPDERVDLALLRCEPALPAEPATFFTAHGAPGQVCLEQVRVCYWHQDSQGLRALTARPLGVSVHTDVLGLHFVNLAEGLPHGASGGAGLCQTDRGVACFGIVRWGGERRPCSTLTGADAMLRFLALTEAAADVRWADATGAGNVHAATQAACLRRRFRVAGTFGALSLLGAAVWSSATGSVNSGVPPSITPPGMVRIPGGSLVPGSSEATARADYLECTRAQGRMATQECGVDFLTSIFAREARTPRGALPASVQVAAFFLDRRETTAFELAGWLSRRTSDFEVVRDPKQLQAWRLPAPVVVSKTGQRIAAVHDGRRPAAESVSVSALEGSFEVAPEEHDQPARLVSWHGAQAYCAALGKRLPTGDEWEWAARRQAGFRFSWGDRPPACSAAVFGRRDGQACAHLPHRPEPAVPGRDQSPLGLLDLAGNVSEWTATSVGAGLRQVRGGHYADAAIMLVASRRSQAYPEALSPHVGFRCARDADRATPEPSEDGAP